MRLLSSSAMLAGLVLHAPASLLPEHGSGMRRECKGSVPAWPPFPGSRHGRKLTTAHWRGEEVKRFCTAGTQVVVWSIITVVWSILASWLSWV